MITGYYLSGLYLKKKKYKSDDTLSYLYKEGFVFNF